MQPGVSALSLLCQDMWREIHGIPFSLVSCHEAWIRADKSDMMIGERWWSQISWYRSGFGLMAEIWMPNAEWIHQSVDRIGRLLIFHCVVNAWYENLSSSVYLRSSDDKTNILLLDLNLHDISGIQFAGLVTRYALRLRHRSFRATAPFWTYGGKWKFLDM
jgi:hypothetical protein